MLNFGATCFALDEIIQRIIESLQKYSRQVEMMMNEKLKSEGKEKM